MDAVREQLSAEFAVQKLAAKRRPARRTRAVERRAGPSERSDVAHQMIAAEVEFQMAFEPQALPGQ